MRRSVEDCGDRGQVVPLFGLVLVTVLVATLLIVRVTSVVSDRTRARAAADAAALSGVRDGRSGAETLAAANGGVLVSFVSSGSTVEVRVRVGSAEASARATTAVDRTERDDNHPGGLPYTAGRVGHPEDE